MSSLRRRARIATASAAAVVIGGLAFTSVAYADEADTIHIGQVQGSIGDDDTDFSSPLHGQTVRVQGVVTQLYLDGNGNKGFYLQERADATDGDPNSSDGIFVFNGGFDTLRTLFDSPAEEKLGANWDVTVGDEIVLQARVGTYFGNIQFSGGSAFVYDVVDTGLDPLEVVEVAEIDPPDDAADSARYFRRHLGMQMTVPADSLVTAGRDVFGTDGEVWAMRGDHEAAQQDGYAARAFRDAHPLDNVPGETFDDGNGYLFVIGSFGVKATAGDADAIIAPAKTYDVIAEPTTGGVYYTFGKFTVNVADNLALEPGLDPIDNRPAEPAGKKEAAIASFNVENLYDFRDDPGSGCDFRTDTGCDDGESSYSPPFDYAPADYESYQTQMERLADQIILDLHEPAILMIQEAEKQDLCSPNPEWTPESSLGADRLVCDLEHQGEENTERDGRPDTLQELAMIVAERGGADYEAAFDADAGDLRGITTAFMYRTDSVELVEADADDVVLGSEVDIPYDGEALEGNSEVQNPKALNAVLSDEVLDQCTASGVRECNGSKVYPRAAQVAKFRVSVKSGWWGPKSGWWGNWWGKKTTDLYLINNHFSSGPDRRVLHRIEQAEYLAAITDTILDEDPKARIVTGGDFNVYPRPDDPFAEGQTIIGDWTGPSDQLAAMYEDSGLTNLYDLALADHPEAAYSYTYQGQTQTLDQMWVSDSVLRNVVDVVTVHSNTDYPADAFDSGEEPAYGRYGVSDHDPEVVTLNLKKLCK